MIGLWGSSPIEESPSSGVNPGIHGNSPLGTVGYCLRRGVRSKCRSPIGHHSCFVMTLVWCWGWAILLSLGTHIHPDKSPIIIQLLPFMACKSRVVYTSMQLSMFPMMDDLAGTKSSVLINNQNECILYVSFRFMWPSSFFFFFFDALSFCVHSPWLVLFLCIPYANLMQNQWGHIAYFTLQVASQT